MVHSYGKVPALAKVLVKVNVVEDSVGVAFQAWGLLVLVTLWSEPSHFQITESPAWMLEEEGTNTSSWTLTVLTAAKPESAAPAHKIAATL